MKKIVSLALALAMIFALCTITASADFLAITITKGSDIYKYEPSSEIWTLNDDTKTDVTATVNALGITATYTDNKTTMTLENVDVDSIEIGNSADITFKGENKIATTVPESWKEMVDYGIACYGDLNITFADGSKAIIGTNGNNENGKYQISRSAIYSDANINIKGSGEATINGCQAGIHAGGTGDKANVDLTGFTGTLNINDFGETFQCGIKTTGKVIITGGTFNFKSINGSNIAATDEINISNATVTATTTSENIGDACLITNGAGKINLTGSVIILNSTFKAMEANTIDINDSTCDVTGSIYLYGGNQSNPTRATFNMNQGTLVVQVVDSIAISGENCDINFNSGFTKLKAEGKNSATITVTNLTDTPSTINYSKVSLYEEKDGQKVINYNAKVDDINIPIVGLGYDGFAYDPIHGVLTNAAKVSTFAKPEYTEGADQTVKAGSEAKFRVNIDDKYFTAAYVDGVKLADTDYTHEHGSTILTLKDSYVKTLAPGKHELKVVYTILEENMEAITTFTIEDESIADTADNTTIGLFVAALGFSAFGTALVAKKRNED